MEEKFPLKVFRHFRLGWQSLNKILDRSFSFLIPPTQFNAVLQVRKNTERQVAIIVAKLKQGSGEEVWLRL